MGKSTAVFETIGEDRKTGAGFYFPDYKNKPGELSRLLPEYKYYHTDQYW